ncbi:MAG: hypothetical protein IJ324_05105 [Lachnospiraceae bacterium]|nr:hypothetical protein [Lachnospiraceae bacterium]
MHKTFGQIIASVPRDYDLIVIEEERIPLVESMTKDYEMWLMITGALIIFFLIFAGVILYRTACEWKRRRIAELEEMYGQPGYKGWNLIRLKKEERRLEMEAIAGEKNFLKKVEPKMLV